MHSGSDFTPSSAGLPALMVCISGRPCTSRLLRSQGEPRRAKAFALALRRTWAEAKAGRSSRRVDTAEYASSFNTWAADRGRALVYLSA